MVDRFEHFLLTRFNVRLNWAKREPTQDWLRRRIELFERFCLPSVRGQSVQDFRWLVFFVPQSPQFLKERNERWRKYPNFRPYFTDAFNSNLVSQAVSEQSAAEFVITSRLDNDDAISRDFIKRVQENFSGQELEFINFSNGYSYKRGRVYRVRFMSNSFISLIEKKTPQEQLRTVLCGIAHGRFGSIGPIRNLAGRPGWMIVVHGENLASRAWGIREPSARAVEHFSLGSDVFARENRLLVGIERICGYIRYGSVAGVKKAAWPFGLFYCSLKNQRNSK